MQLTFSSTVTENAYVGITMSGLTLNQNSSVLGTTIDTSWNRGPIPLYQSLSGDGKILMAYTGSTWSVGLSGSLLEIRNVQGGLLDVQTIIGEPSLYPPYVGFPLGTIGNALVVTAGMYWRACRLDQQSDNLSFGGATFTGPSLDLDQIMIPQPQISFKNPSKPAFLGGGATFTNVEWEIYTQDSNDTPRIGLFWEDGYGGNNQWLNYNPHYFLFYYRGRKKKGGVNGREKQPGGFMHPASVLGPIGVGVTGPTCTGVLRGYPSSVNNRDNDTNNYVSGWRTTEWPVGLTSGNPTFITEMGGTLSYSSFHPNQYWANDLVNQTPFPYYSAGNQLPRYSSTDSPTIYNGGMIPKNQRYMYFRFAIGIFYDSPSGIRKVIFGPMSETLRITPRAKSYGVQFDSYAIKKWIFSWQARLV
jgi:hypothetical protein